MPKVSRGWPVTTSNPTVERRKPAAIMTAAFAGAPPGPMKVPNAIKSTPNISGGPKLKASSANGIGEKVKRTAAIRAPTNETTKPADMASAALPCSARSLPSNMTATDQGLPGTAKRIEVMSPPCIAPQ